MQDPTVIEGVSNSEFLRTARGSITGEKVNLSAEGVEPAVGGVPYEDYLVTGLNGSIYKGVLDISLKFGNFPTKFNGTLIE